MDTRMIGLVLIWIGAIMLVAVLQQRMRQGALGEDAFEKAPPIARWAVAIAAAGMALALLGIFMTLWSLV